MEPTCLDDLAMCAVLLIVLTPLLASSAAIQTVVFTGSESSGSTLVAALDQLQLLNFPSHCYSLQKAIRSDLESPDEFSVEVVLKWLPQRTNCSDVVVSLPTTEPSSANAVLVTRDNSQFNAMTTNGASKDDGQLSRTQLMVISTCSVVIGLFFIAALAMRLRNYMKRRRRPTIDRWGSSRSSNSGKHPGIGQSSARQKSPLAGPQAEQQSLTQPVIDQCPFESNNWTNHNQTSTGSIPDEKPLLIITSASLPSSPSLPRLQMDFLEPDKKPEEDSCSDPIQDHNANKYISESTNAPNDEIAVPMTEQEVPDASWEGERDPEVLCRAGFTQSDLSLTSRDGQNGYSYGNQQEYTGFDIDGEDDAGDDADEEEEEEEDEKEEDEEDSDSESSVSGKLLPGNEEPDPETSLPRCETASSLLGPDFEGMTPTYV